MGTAKQGKQTVTPEQVWQNLRAKEIKKRLSSNPVFAALGTSLKEAMISNEVMRVMCSVDMPGYEIQVSRFTALYRSICTALIPEAWGGE